ncbi:MAG: ABC transporter ATP-binding protein [Spirochaeta sp.]|nr:ABC transporter ATP-binding protein [Spirochaeta sp.]
MEEPVIQVEGLTVEYRIGHTWFEAVQAIDLQINPVQIHGLVGESGSGKSTLGAAMIHHLARNARIAAGRILFGDRDLRESTDREMEQIWGNQIGFVPQNTMDSLNPSLRILKQMRELTQKHLGITSEEAEDLAAEALRHVQIADPLEVLSRYPHQLSGGMLQRVMIAMALSTRPKLVLLDEPTTALDVTTQAVILDLLRDLIKEEQAAALYVSHDLGTVAQLCDYVTVLYAGEVMESAPVETLFAHPRHPYTVGLLACLPTSVTGNETRLTTIEGVAPALGARSDACVFADRCPLATDQCRREKPPLEKIDASRTVRCWRWQEIADGSVTPFSGRKEDESGTAPRRSLVLKAQGMSKRFGDKNLLDRLSRKPVAYVQALRDVSIEVNSRSTFGLVGESGSGKTTLARSILALLKADEGQIVLQDQPISLELWKRDREILRNLRIVFQNPDDSLNPYRSVGQTIDRTIAKLAAEKLSRSAIRAQTRELLEAVGLSAEYYDRRPGQLSGGEKQLVAIARAFAPRPALIVADEPTSSLDVSVQAVILNLLKDLRAREGASYIVISHDLEVVSYLADHIAVMYLGEIVEQGAGEAVLNVPSHPYTEALLSAAPTPDPTVRHHPIVLHGEIPSPRNRPTGCPFHTRCPRKIGPICENELPPVRTDEDGHEIRCHYPLEELRRLQRNGPAHTAGEGGDR